MRKVFYLIAVISFFVVSCSTERSAVDKLESTKTLEMIDFDNAFRSLGNPANKPTVEEKNNGSVELSDRRKKILVPASIALIKSTGVTDQEIQRKTKGDITSIIVWAIEINLKMNQHINKGFQLK